MNESPFYILGIESSCDDTSAAVLNHRQILSNVVANQDVHKSFGGVVPELASRAHQKNIVPVVSQALKLANIKPSELSAIAFTKGPGLMGSLLVGAGFAQSMAMALKIPLVDVHHMHAHVLVHFIEDERQSAPQFPFICLTVSGGHTQLVLVNSPLNMQIVGSTIDDAAGEAFDKTAKMLALPYPGGPVIDKLAQAGNPDALKFNKPQIPGFDFSFSGLKTSILYTLRDRQKSDPDYVQNHLADICASVQHTIIEILMDKLQKAMAHFDCTSVAIAGGVSANSLLRKRVTELGQENHWQVHIPPFEYTTDNAAMIAITGYLKLQDGYPGTKNAKPEARLGF